MSEAVKQSEQLHLAPGEHHFSVNLPGREEMTLYLTIDQDGLISESRLLGIGPSDFLDFIMKWRQKLNGPLVDLQLPEGNMVCAIMLRELISRAQGKWEPPYQQDELCHCRAIPTEAVDRAIICGAHTPAEVSAQTSASTACGTCQPDVEAMIVYRLANK